METVKQLNDDGLQLVYTDFDSIMEAMRTLPSDNIYLASDVTMNTTREWTHHFRKITCGEDHTSIYP